MLLAVSFALRCHSDKFLTRFRHSERHIVPKIKLSHLTSERINTINFYYSFKVYRTYRFLTNFFTAIICSSFPNPCILAIKLSFTNSRRVGFVFAQYLMVDSVFPTAFAITPYVIFVSLLFRLSSSFSTIFEYCQAKCNFSHIKFSKRTQIRIDLSKYILIFSLHLIIMEVVSKE